MADWWWVALVVTVVLVVVAFVVMRRRNAQTPGSGRSDPARNYREERETDRLGGMSAEDQAWERASLERNRKAQERDQAPRPHRVRRHDRASSDARVEANRRQTEAWDSEGGAIPSPGAEGDNERDTDR